jgi:hypothetical protein
MPWLERKIRAVEAGAGHQHHAADTGRGRRAAGFGDALDGERGRFRFTGAAFELRCRGHLGIEQIEIGEIARQQRGIGEADIFVIGRDARHGDGALGELATPSPLTSLVETTAWRRPTSTRSPTSSPSERSDSSTRPSRTSTPCEMPRTATASAASAPARLAASTRRCASVLSAD